MTLFFGSIGRFQVGSALIDANTKNVQPHNHLPVTMAHLPSAISRMHESLE
jgi:hypothetical protein